MLSTLIEACLGGATELYCKGFAKRGTTDFVVILTKIDVFEQKFDCRFNRLERSDGSGVSSNDSVVRKPVKGSVLFRCCRGNGFLSVKNFVDFGNVLFKFMLSVRQSFVVVCNVVLVAFQGFEAFVNFVVVATDHRFHCSSVVSITFL